MKRHSVIGTVIGMTVLAAGWASLPFFAAAAEPEQKQAQARRAARETARHTRQNVEKVIAGLDDAQRALADHPHDQAAIRQISLFPGHRVGARFGDLNERQRESMDRLLAGIFTKDALKRIHEVFKQGSGQGDYYFARFRDDRPSDPLTWRVEGHHFSATFFIDEKDRMHPGTLLIGGQGDVWKPLDQKVRALFASLDDDQKQKVMLEEAPRRTGHPPHKDTVSRPGLAWKDLTGSQKESVSELLESYVKLFEEGVLHTSLRAFKRAGGHDTLHLVFAGNPGEATGEYHCGLSGGAGAHFEFDTRDGHVHMLLHFGEVKRRAVGRKAATQPSE